jgi:hypothetical protein
MANPFARLIPRWKDIADIDTGDVYISRLMLIRTRLFGVYLHIIRRPDWAQCEHDHPWSFTTLILRGGYVEEIGGKEFTRRPLYIGRRPRGFEHKITRLLNGPAVTLVFRGPNHEEWGFRTRRGWVSWRQYKDWPLNIRVLWCDDSPEKPR